MIAVNLLNDLVIIISNIVIFSAMLNFRALKMLNKVIISIVCSLLVVAYSICAYWVKMPLIHATVLCFTIPSLILFWSFSKIKDSRFFLSFCMVDTISLIIAFITKYLAVFYESVAPYITLTINIIAYSLLIVVGFKYFKLYAQLLTFKKAGWSGMMIASFMIYFALYFFAAYPTPLLTRVEYAPCYIVFCGVVLSCYVVFLDSIIKTKKLHEQYKELEREKIFHRIAYMDSLTGLYNRVYYVEKINELERTCDKYNNICSIVLDINNFKIINDRFGHHVGDLVLQDTASKISMVFQDLSSYMFRIGGDEFFVLLLDVDERDIQQRLSTINSIIAHNDNLQDHLLSIASGYSIINVHSAEKRITIEQNFMKADKNMYEDKKQYKLTHKIPEPINSYDRLTR